MELRHLRYFVAIAEDLSLNRAAEPLHVAQPALSRHIQDLEHDLGATLFLRTSRGLTLTPAGYAARASESRSRYERSCLAA